MTKKKDPKDLKKVGRSTKMTSEVLAKLEQAFSIGASDRQACKYANIDPATLYRYQERNPKFCERKEMLKETPILKAKFAVYKGLDDPKIALDYLKLRDEDFSPKVKQEVTNKTPQIVVANQADADLLKRIADVTPD